MSGDLSARASWDRLPRTTWARSPAAASCGCPRPPRPLVEPVGRLRPPRNGVHSGHRTRPPTTQHPWCTVTDDAVWRVPEQIPLYRAQRWRPFSGGGVRGPVRANLGPAGHGGGCRVPRALRRDCLAGVGARRETACVRGHGCRNMRVELLSGRGCTAELRRSVMSIFFDRARADCLGEGARARCWRVAWLRAQAGVHPVGVARENETKNWSPSITTVFVPRPSSLLLPSTVLLPTPPGHCSSTRTRARSLSCYHRHGGASHISVTE